MQRALFIVLFYVLPGACQTITCDKANAYKGTYVTDVDNGYCKGATFSATNVIACTGRYSCLDAKFYDTASATCSYVNSCTSATFNDKSIATCGKLGSTFTGGSYACNAATFNDNSIANCIDTQSCKYATFHGDAIAICSGKNACTDRLVYDDASASTIRIATFYGNSRANCTVPTACLGATFNDNACCTGIGCPTNSPPCVNANCVLGAVPNPNDDCTASCQLLTQPITQAATGLGTCNQATHQCSNEEGLCVVNANCVLGAVPNPSDDCTASCQLLTQPITQAATGSGTCAQATHQCSNTEGLCVAGDIPNNSSGDSSSGIYSSSTGPDSSSTGPDSSSTGSDSNSTIPGSVSDAVTASALSAILLPFVAALVA